MPRGCKVFQRVDLLKATDQLPSQDPEGVRDVILHALLARLALCSGETVEFKTNYNKASNTVELDFPDGLLPVLDEILGMQRGPRMQAYINWLIGKQAIIDDVPNIVEQTTIDKDFISASSLDIWTGAKIGNLDDEKIVIFLPVDCLSVLGYNTKVNDEFTTGQVVISLIWVYESGDNGSNTAASFDIQTSMNISVIDGNTITTVSDTTTIPTFNLVKGDVRETNILTATGIQSGDMLAISIKRNFSGSSDPETEFVGILGLKVKLIQD